MASQLSGVEVKITAYIISLSPEQPRSVQLTEQLASIGATFRFINAVDGRKLDLDHFDGYDKAHARRYMGRDLIGGEIGCYLSHCKAAVTFLNSQDDYAIVLEDDAAVPNELLQSVEKVICKLNNTDPNWLLVNIGKSSRKFNSELGDIGTEAEPRELQAAHYFPMTTHGLLWSRRGAERFLAQDEPIFAPVDNYMRHWLTRIGHGYAVHPPLIDVIGAPSDIEATAPKTAAMRRHIGRAWHFALTKQRRLLIDKLRAAKMKSRFNRAQPNQGA